MADSGLRAAADVNSYRKKPIVIEAIRWDGKNWQEVYDFTTTTDGTMVTGPHPQIEDYGKVVDKICVTIETLEGLMTARQGDWIIKGVKGEFYPCKPDIFEATYESVNTRVGDGMVSVARGDVEEAIAWLEFGTLSMKLHSTGASKVESLAARLRSRLPVESKGWE